MITPDFTFEAMLAFKRKNLSKEQVKGMLEFIKNFTIEINEIDLSKIKYGGTILN